MNSLKYLFAFALGAITFAGCSKDETLPMPDNGPKSVQFLLNYSVPATDIVVTRAAMDEQFENKVNNLYLLIFDGSGDRVRVNNTNDQSYFEQGNGLTETDSQTTKGNITNPITVEGSGDAKDFSVYAIANIVAENGTSTYGVTQNMLNDINNIEDLNNAVATLYENSLSRPNTMMMVGKMEDLQLTSESSGSYVSNGTIYLRRIDSKITFNVSNGTYNGLPVVFKPESYQLMNMPMQSYLIERSTSAAAASGTDFSVVPELTYNSNPLQFEFNATSNAYDTFTFYMLESNLAPKQAPTAFNDRDQKLKNPNTGDYQVDANGNWVWEYANDAAPYVQIKGSVEIKGQTEIIRADAVYNIHLGHFNSAQSVNNFFTQRNTFYTYNLTIDGVQNIRLEVTKNDDLTNDPQSGAEGNVVVASNIRNVDCHYTQIMLTLKKPDATNAEKLSWYVDTPYSVGQFIPNESDTKNFDYKWVEFYVHGSATTTMATYQTAKGNTHYVDEIVKQMKLWATGSSNLFDNNSDTAYVTAFINEFYYEYPFQYGNIEVQKNEAQGKYNKAELVTMIKKCVNGDSRYMHILSDIAYSPDGDSSETNSQVSIIQRPIRTVYNVDKMNETNYLIWGTESVNETYYLMEGQIPSMSDATSKTNGLKNTYALWLGNNRPVKNSNWSQYIDYSAGSELTNEPNVKSQDVGSYNQHSIYACMSRNQDTNGNGIIDESEIKWYMAAINQLSDLYIGESGLDPEAKLYPDVLKDLVPGASAKHKKQYYHYLSSTSGGSGGTVLWAEEGTSTSDNKTTNWGDDPGGGSQTNNKYMRLVRCLRNLGEDINTGNDVTPLMTYNSDTRIFDISMMNTASFRSSYYGSDAVVTPGDQNDPYNKPRARFQIAERKNTSSGLGHCPNGFREPSMRELAIIFNLMGTSIQSDSPYGCVTRCSNKESGTQYYEIAKPLWGSFCIQLNPINTNRTFRCVKDLE